MPGEQGLALLERRRELKAYLNRSVRQNFYFHFFERRLPRHRPQTEVILFGDSAGLDTSVQRAQSGDRLLDWAYAMNSQVHM